MNKTQLLAFITKLTTSMKRIFPLKTEVTQDIATAKQEAMAYADTKAGEVPRSPAKYIKVDGDLDLNNYTNMGVYIPETTGLNFTNAPADSGYSTELVKLEVRLDSGGEVTQIYTRQDGDYYKRSYNSSDEAWDNWDLRRPALRTYVDDAKASAITVATQNVVGGAPNDADTLKKLNTKMLNKVNALKNDITSLGSFVGTASTYADLPTVDYQGENVANGDVAYLDTVDGDHKRGYYRFDGNSYQFMSGDLQHDDILGLMKATTLDDTVDNMFVTPKWVKDYNDSNEPSQEEVDGAVDNG